MSRWPGIYVAAPWVDGPRVLEVHQRLVAAHLRPTSRWAYAATGGSEALQNVPPHERQAAIEGNDADISSSAGMLVLARHGLGGEMFVEFAAARFLNIPVYWVGREILSTYRHGVKRCLDVNAAIAAMKEDFNEGREDA